ncbi:hypothetical protein D9611_001696 [Ephemerocybe angulata]|uniref:Reverse transcriptase domain-containing protein n=1 Tax=Ephemerocybe angulata TaxID=980116 RepID=A0A8H5CIQ5_9AGAR|nr:hypothetical protein D9611_001696 [Tulosesus angulatus]
MRANKIGILVVQETHLNRARASRIQTTYDKTMFIKSSSELFDVNTSSEGVAMLIDRRVIKSTSQGIKSWDVIAGRALMVSIPWRTETGKLHILCVYAPNDPERNGRFWEDIAKIFDDNPDWPHPDFLVGDLNMVEEARDREPPSACRAAMANALMNLLEKFHLVDGWRRENPNLTHYTWRSRATTGPQAGCRSRIDRIYIKRSLWDDTRDWNITIDQPIYTDHELIQTTIYDLSAPFIGKGRWEIPSFLLNHDKFLEEMDTLCTAAELATRQTNNPTDPRPQMVLEDLKVKMRDKAREIAKAAVPKARKKIAELKQALETVLNDNSTTPEERNELTDKLAEEIKDLECQQLDKRRADTATLWMLETETIGKKWIGANKERAPHDTIPILRNPNTPNAPPARKSCDMAEIARDYHEQLQNDTQHTEQEREAATEEVLASLDPRVDDGNATHLKTNLTRDEVRTAMMSMPNGKASGPDGITTDLWKVLITRWETQVKAGGNGKAADVVSLLQHAFNDIEENGISATSSFAKGWMCPLYKKNDRSDIANYRPITVLNSDYKSFMKALTIRLAPVALKLIHPDQAGFMKGRRIDDHTELVNLMINWCELKEENGLLVFLDQEKAYDKITHRFLQSTLDKFGFPDHFKNVIKSLYDNAETVVIINGEISTTFRVIRGVRQGDPLSCLLFNLAIESLANLLRKSGLKGFKIKETIARIITKLFADDTTVYLSAEDNFSDLQIILDLWCRASGGKFNVTKTEIVPVGAEEYRAQVAQTRLGRPGEPESQLPDGVHIARDGEPVRVLGAHVGNKIDQMAIWAPILDTLEKKVSYWLKSNPSLEGRSYLTKLEPGARTLYKAMVQCMPEQAEKTVAKTINKIMWGGKAVGVSHAVASLPYAQGGKKVLNIVHRNEATHLKRSVRYAADMRGDWAIVADQLIEEDIPDSQKVDDLDATMHVFLQTWSARKQRAASTLPDSIFRMLSIAAKYNIRYAPPILSEATRRALPAWYHPGKQGTTNTRENGRIPQCLRDIHGIFTVGQLEAFVSDYPHPPTLVEPLQNGPPEPNDHACHCAQFTGARDAGCADPIACHERALSELDSLGEKWDPRSPLPTVDSLTERYKLVSSQLALSESKKVFDPLLETYSSLESGFRVFEPTKCPWSRSPLKALPTPDLLYAPPRAFIAIHIPKASHPIQRAGYGVIFEGRAEADFATISRLDIPRTQLWTTAVALFDFVVRAPQHEHLRVYVPSMKLIEDLTSRLQINEDGGWIEHECRRLMPSLVARLRSRSGLLVLCGYTDLTDASMRKKAKEAAASAVASHPLNEPVRRFATKHSQIVQGLRLASQTQASLYAAIGDWNSKKVSERRETLANIALAKNTARQKLGFEPTTEEIWMSIRGPNVTQKKIRAFLWKVVHGALPCGVNWNDNPAYADRALCQHCQVRETAEHLLVQCPRSCQSTIWDLANSLLRRRGLPPLSPATLGDILVCGLPNKKRKLTPGQERLRMIVIAESAWLIWVLRCKWVIDDEADPELYPSVPEITNRWWKMINAKLDFDLLASDAKRYGPKAIVAGLVKDTWEGLLDDGATLGKSLECHRNVGVLVGRGVAARRPPGWNR